MEMIELELLDTDAGKITVGLLKNQSGGYSGQIYDNQHIIGYGDTKEECLKTMKTMYENHINVVLMLELKDLKVKLSK